MNTKIFACLFFVFLTVPALASIPEFSAIDTDKDGTLSQSEALEAGISEHLFAKVDLDGDLKLNADEYNLLALIGQS